jgi:EAL domain-containing protein (putative c-di-GMP-specific phosphodiesterase class I)
MSDLEAANNFIQSLRKRGYHVCLDDFGAGAASFQYLSVLEVDVVKLDGSAVKNAQKAAKGRAFLSALTELCKRMGVETIAEMVDTPDTLDFCRDCGCNYVQGFLFGKPSRDVRDFSPLPQSQLFKPLTALRYDPSRRLKSPITNPQN